jgi:carboxyl-terminal processing protease
MDKSGLAYAYDPGALKVTISKFYRPNGASTQLRGVAADVVLPSTSDFSDVSEGALKDPLPWDAVPPASHEQQNRVKPYLKQLREQSSRRVGAAKDFAALQDEIARLKKNIAAKTISLNEAEREREQAETKARKAEREAALKALQAAQPPTYEITLKNAQSRGLPKAAQAKVGPEVPPAGTSPDDSEGGPTVQAFAESITLNEGVQILADYTELLRGPASAPAPAPALAK